MAEEKKTVKGFNETITEVSSLLVKEPDALTIELRKDPAGRHYYTFVNNSIKAKGIRRKARRLLSDLYQSGVYNFHQFATRLRVEDIDILALLDDEWREEHGIQL